MYYYTYVYYIMHGCLCMNKNEKNVRFTDVPSEGVYMVCGVLIAMVLVAVIIVVLAVTIR